MDVAKSLAGGVGKGTAGMIGLPGDLSTALNRGLTAGGSFDRYSCLVFPADNGTFSVTFGVLPEDTELRLLREDAATVVFADINPQAPIHVLVVPKRHFTDIGALAADPAASAAVLSAIRGFADDRGLRDYRTVFNTGAGAGQSVFHVHAHVLAGRPFGWPPG